MKSCNAIILATLMAAAPAMAQQAGDLHQARVSYADINTASGRRKAGLAPSDSRTVSRTLCGPEPDMRDLKTGTCCTGLAFSKACSGRLTSFRKGHWLPR